MRNLWLLISLMILMIPGQAAADITTGLVGYWPFSGDAQDASGNGNHGSLVNGPTLTVDRHGNPDSAFHFDGLATRIDIPPSATLDSPTTAITMAAYVRRDGWGMVGSQYNPILTKSISTAEGFQYRFITTPSGLGTAFNHWSTSSSLPYTFNDDQWYHVASTWEADTAKSYVNGQLLKVEYLPTTLNADGRSLSIGSDFPGILEIFSGDIDEVRIYNRALSPEDISALVDLVSPVPDPFGPGPGIVLGNAFPNPLSMATTLSFSLGQSRAVDVEIIDVAGRRVRRLLAGQELSAGEHALSWDGRDAAGRPVVAGTYLYRVSTRQGSATGKLIVTR